MVLVGCRVSPTSPAVPQRERVYTISARRTATWTHRWASLGQLKSAVGAHSVCRRGHLLDYVVSVRRATPRRGRAGVRVRSGHDRTGRRVRERPCRRAGRRQRRAARVRYFGYGPTGNCVGHRTARPLEARHRPERARYRGRHRCLASQVINSVSVRSGQSVHSSDDTCDANK